MSLSPHRRTQSKPRVCPDCGKPYLARIRPRQDTHIRLSRLYRHSHGGYVYLHEIPGTAVDGGEV